MCEIKGALADANNRSREYEWTRGLVRKVARGHAKGREGKNEGEKGIALAKATQINENKEGAADKKRADFAPILEEMLARIELMCNFTPQNKNILL